MPPPTKPRSVSRRTVGQVLTILGGAQIVGGLVTLALIDPTKVKSRPDDYGDSFGFWFITVPLLANGVLMTGVGIPLWVSGAEDVPTNPGQVPQLSLGAGSVTLTGQF